MRKILFVCLGNICRSAMAEGILKQKIAMKKLELSVDSAGTCNNHIGQAPDKRMQQKALDHGINISKQKARQFDVNDFDKFDYIFVMDSSNKEDVLKLCRTKEDVNKVDLFLNLSQPHQNLSVPDPYFGGGQGFEEVYQLLNTACDAFINSLN